MKGKNPELFSWLFDQRGQPGERNLDQERVQKPAGQSGAEPLIGRERSIFRYFKHRIHTVEKHEVFSVFNVNDILICCYTVCLVKNNLVKYLGDVQCFAFT